MCRTGEGFGDLGLKPKVTEVLLIAVGSGVTLGALFPEAAPLLIALLERMNGVQWCMAVGGTLAASLGRTLWWARRREERTNA